MTKPEPRVPEVSWHEAHAAIAESIRWRDPFDRRMDWSALAAAVHHLPEVGCHTEDPGDRPLIPLPLNLRETAVLAYLDLDGSLAQVVPVGPGRFVYGHGNDIFGRWNALVAAHTQPRCTVFRAHAGEIIPGTIDEHIDRIRRNLAEGTTLPVQVDIDVSMACPSACLFCFSSGYRGSRSSGRLMNPQLMLDLIRQSAQQGVKVVRFDGGGDPLTHPALLRAVDLCRELRLRSAVLTAGDLLAERHIPGFVRARTYVRVSLNAAGDATRRTLHGQRTGRYGLQPILDTVHCLRARRDTELGTAGPAEMPIGATSMIHPVNAAETLAIAERARQAGFDHLSFRVILGKDHKVPFTTAAREQLSSAFDEIRRRVADESFQVFLPTRDITDQGYVPGRYFERCRASTHRALIEVGPAPERAALIPCGRYRGHGYRPGTDPDRMVFGYLSKTEPLKDVWLGEHMKQLLTSFPQRCEDCIDRSANLFLRTAETILRADPGSIFVPFAVPSSAGDDAYA